MYSNSFFFNYLFSNSFFLNFFYFFISNLIRLKERIDELHLEINSAKEDFKFLHRERGQLTKDRDLQKQEIEVWGTKCRELQMLKFGREIDLEELEEKSDRSKEFEAEATLSSNADKFKKKSQKLFGVSARLQEQLAEVSLGLMCIVCVYMCM